MQEHTGFKAELSTVVAIFNTLRVCMNDFSRQSENSCFITKNLIAEMVL